MKTFHSILIGGAMALGLAACSSTPMPGDTGASMSSGRSASGATASSGADNGAGVGGSNNATNGAVPVTPPTLDGTNPPPNVPSGTATKGVDAGAGNR